MTENDVQINSHPFFHGEHGQTERELLLKLTPLCNWNTSVGIISYLPKSPSLQIGIVDETKIIPGQMPHFTQSINIQLSSRENPLNFMTKFDPEFCEKVLNPLFKNWIAFAELIIEMINDKKIAKPFYSKNIEFWKQYPVAEHQSFYFNSHNHF
ncbi:MAG: hypothetical protein WCO66_00030 [Candidatus Absconditabacteria bacterium]